MLYRTRTRLILVLLLTLSLSGCLFRSHKVQMRMSTAALQTATREQLVDIVNSEAARIQTLDATVDMDASVGGSVKGKITEYQEIRGYILVPRARACPRRPRQGTAPPASPARRPRRSARETS